MRRARLFAVVAAAALIAAACGGKGTTASTTGGGGAKAHVTFLIDFFPSGAHAAFYSAIAEGFFAQEHLDVTIQHVIGGTEVIKELVAGKAQFGYADFASMASADQKQNAGLEAVMGVLEQTPMSILSPASNGISKPSDLKGKKIVDFAGSSTQIVWPVFLKQNNLTSSDVNLQLVDPATRLTLVTEGKADASVGFWTDNAPQLQLQCKCTINVVKWSQFGIDTLSNGIVTNASYVQTNPDIVKRFVAAVAKGIEFAKANPAKATADLLKLKSKDITLPASAVQQQSVNELSLTTSPSGGGTPTGLMTETDWKNTVDLMVTAGQMDPVSDVSQFYTNKFVPGAS